MFKLLFIYVLLFIIMNDYFAIKHLRERLDKKEKELEILNRRLKVKGMIYEQ